MNCPKCGKEIGKRWDGFQNYISFYLEIEGELIRKDIYHCNDCDEFIETKTRVGAISEGLPSPGGNDNLKGTPGSLHETIKSSRNVCKADLEKTNTGHDASEEEP